ncbi:MAG: Wadjet anti-phage system protein JetD domain-containing protein [Bacteroidia bacterium]
MISIDDIRKKALNFYANYLSSRVAGESFFPKSIRSNKKPSEKEFSTLKKELLPLLENSFDKLGYGYKVHLKTIKSAKLGEQNLPEQIVFEKEADYLKFLRKETEVSRFVADVNKLLELFPNLREWILKNPLRIVAQQGKWDSLLLVLDFFVKNPRPQLYTRELPISVHTKFVEQNKGIIEELLMVLCPDQINSEGSTFEDRLSLKRYEPYFHIKILDKNIAQKHFSGLTDIGITPTELKGLVINVSRIIIIENKQNYKNVENFLSLPMMKETIAVFGSGYRSGELNKIDWLKSKQLYYWGDIDLHGFEILSYLRKSYPGIQSFLMDELTFETFQSERVQGSFSKVNVLNHLDVNEEKLYKRLLNLTERNRLEQEKIPNDYVLKALQKIL